MYAEVLFPINAEAFTYRIPEELRTAVKKGVRVSVPFKRGKKTGVVLSRGRKETSGLKTKAIRDVSAVLDAEPVVHGNILRAIQWVGQYYMSTSGLALKHAVPAPLFSGRKTGKQRITYDDRPAEGEQLILTAEQKRVLKVIKRSEKKVFLLHGVTGSGKTEVYIQAIKSLQRDEQAIVLVPEIAITAQMIDRFRSRFGDEAVFYHSGLSDGERLRSWQQMSSGAARVVVGVRSAVFSPFRNLGLIVVDEEQESSYKQFEGLRYSARDVALARSQLEGCRVILGSATPSLEAFYHARAGKFEYLHMTKRIEERQLPEVTVIDMTKEERESFFLSKRLMSALRENKASRHQSLLLLNRRGYAPYFICTDCGHTSKCPSCSITLIYHKDTNTLNCHYCGNHLYPETVCPRCGGASIKYLGAGTQRVEEEVKELIPELSFTRMDRDTTRKKHAHYNIIRDMENKKIDVLLGTQMIAKGHDFPDVTLSAVISSDIALNLPDFRSGERSFQLFTQLAGRAGRGEVPGRALIQTFEADHYIFDYVRKHDYLGFYNHEIELRRELAYPPFSRLLRIILNFRTKEQGERTSSALSKYIARMGQRNIDVLGPAPAPIEKIRRLWRWHVVMKGKNSKALRECAFLILNRLKSVQGVKTEIDVDPINLL